MVLRDRALAGLVVTTGAGTSSASAASAVAGLGVMHALPGPQHRVLGGEQHLHRLLDRVRIGRRALHRHRRVVERALELGLGHLVGDFDQHRAALPERMA